MTRIVVRNTSVLTLDDRNTFLFPGTVIIEGDKIVELIHGEREAGKDHEGTTIVIDGKDKLLMPGLVDLHFHTSVAKGYNDTLPLWEYLDTVWYPSIRALDPEKARTAALYSYITALKSGTTTVNDMYRFVDALADAASQCGIRAVLSNDVALEEHRLDSLDDNIGTFQRNDGRENERIRVWLGVEWIPLADSALLAAVGKAKKRLGTGVHIHLCESTSEVDNTYKRFGKSPVQLAHEAGILGPDCVAAHCVHLSDEDIDILAKTGTSVSYNPGSNAKLGNGVMRLQDLLAKGVNVGLGVDACECHNSTDMFETLKFGSYAQRALHQDSSLGQARDLLHMATQNGARALGINAGSIEVGKKADVILLDLKKDMMFTPLFRGLPTERQKMLESHLVFGCNGTAVDTVIVDGKIVMQGRKVLNVDEEKVREDVEVLFEDLVTGMEKQRFERQKI